MAMTIGDLAQGTLVAGRSFVGYEPIDVGKTVDLVAGLGGEIDALPRVLAAMNRTAKTLNINARLVAAVMLHETDALRSSRYRQWRNPGGIAIDADGSEEVWRPDVPNPDQVGAMLVVALAQKVHRSSFRKAVPGPYAVKGMSDWLDRSLAFTKAPGYPSFTTTTTEMTLPFRDETGELQYVWAEDQNWDTAVEGWYQRVPKAEGDPMPTPTKPVIHELSTDYARYGLAKWQADTIVAKRIENRAGFQPQGIVFHIQDGRTVGSLEYWVGVQASSTVMINKDGTILNIIPRKHGPWTNGDSSNPSARGRTLISLGGGDANRVSVTCEMEGVPGDALTPEQKNAAVWWALDVMREFPHIDTNDFYQHADINSVTRPNCPDGYFPGLVAAITDALDAPPPRQKPTIDWIRGESGLGTYNGTPVLKLVAAATLVADTTSRYGASTKAKAFRRYKKDQKVVVVGTFDSGWSVIDAGDGAFPRVASMRLKPSYPKPKDVS